LELIRRDYTKEQLDVPGYFEFKIRIQEIALIGLKHINLKRLLMPFVSSLEKTNGYGFKQKLSENKSTG
jgi:hypothetical protein